MSTHYISLKMCILINILDKISRFGEHAIRLGIIDIRGPIKSMQENYTVFSKWITYISIIIITANIMLLFLLQTSNMVPEGSKFFNMMWSILSVLPIFLSGLSIAMSYGFIMGSFEKPSFSKLEKHRQERPITIAYRRFMKRKYILHVSLFLSSFFLFIFVMAAILISLWRNTTATY